MPQINKNVMDKMAGGRQYRDVSLSRIELREEENGDRIVEGYATIFDAPYELYRYGDYIVMEQVDRAAFNDCDMSDVIMQYNHEGRVFARTSNSTLTVTPDTKGLRIHANLGGTSLGQQVYEDIKGGYTDKMSIGFIVGRDKREVIEDKETGITTVTRTILKFTKLYDVSAVSIPANDATSISARNYGEGVVAEILQELQSGGDLARRKKYIKILTEV